MAEKYYRLNPECFLVKGITGGMIINIYEGRVVSIDDKLSDLLLKSEHGMPIDMENENLNKLIEMGWADEYDPQQPAVSTMDESMESVTFLESKISNIDYVPLS